MSGEIIPVTLHTSDLVVSSDERTRRISAWQFYKTPEGLSVPTSLAAADVLAAPARWLGKCEAVTKVEDTALQAYIGDDTDPGNQALLALRSSECPDNWVNYKAVDVLPGVAPAVDGNKTTFADLWPESSLEWESRGGSVGKTICLARPGHPASFRFTIRQPDGHTFEFVDGQALLKDAAGNVWARVPAAHGWDSLGRSIRVLLRQGEDEIVGGTRYPTIEMVPDVDDLAQSMYPVWIDPTTTLNADADVDDTTVQCLTSATRYASGGSNTAISSGGSSTVTVSVDVSSDGWGGNLYSDIRTLIRINDKTKIPAGTISALRLKIKTESTVNASLHADAYVIKGTGNSSWVEGTKNNATGTGTDCTWNKRSVSPDNNWDGAVGLTTSGTDYYADASPPSITPAATNTWYTYTLSASTARDWRDSNIPNGGMLLASTQTATGTWSAGFTSSEGTAANAPTWEIDYTSGGSTTPRKMSSYRRRRA